jgi:hypothetical protein
LAALQRKAKKEMAELAHAKSKQMELPLATLPAPVTEQKNIAVAPKPFDVDNLTVRDARNIYAQLKEFFNDMK